MSVATNEETLEELLPTLLPAFEASLDPLCIVNRGGQIIHDNSAMRTLLKLRPKMLRQGVVFCDLVKLTACQSSCQIINAIEACEVVRLDETPAVIAKAKARLIVKCVPIVGVNSNDANRKRKSSVKEAIGAMISVRDTSGEIVLQAKYHKALHLLDEQETENDRLLRHIKSRDRG